MEGRFFLAFQDTVYFSKDLVYHLQLKQTEIHHLFCSNKSYILKSIYNKVRKMMVHYLIYVQLFYKTYVSYPTATSLGLPPQLHGIPTPV